MARNDRELIIGIFVHNISSTCKGIVDGMNACCQLRNLTVTWRIATSTKSFITPIVDFTDCQVVESIASSIALIIALSAITTIKILEVFATVIES